MNTDRLPLEPNPDDRQLYEFLESGIDSGQVPGITAEAKACLVRYVRLLDHWNHTYNLTAVRSPQQMIIRHILDSLSVVAYLRGQRMLDVGTGAGLPGLVLAISCPWSEWVLLDANRKKTRFCRHVLDQIGIKNAQPIQTRIQELADESGFDLIISRAAIGITELLRFSRRLWRPNARVIAMKASAPSVAELDSIKLGATIQVAPVTVPLLDAERHLVLMDDPGRGSPEG